jgi:signal peptidase
MVAVESGRMEPHMYRGDLVFLMGVDRFPPAAAQGETGVVTYQSGQSVDYRSFGDYGDVVVYSAGGPGGTAIIHRVRFWVDAGENWYPRVNQAYIPEGVNGCEDLQYCPADHAGFITKGDANRYYDQANRISPPVRPEWIRGTAELRIPWLGHVRLFVSDALATNRSVDSTPTG